MKKAVLLKLLLLVTCWSYAQSTYNITYFNDAGWPGGTRTGFILNKTGWTEVDSGGTFVNAWSRTQPVPFNFLFFGQPVTHFKVSDNMILTFDTTDSRLPDNNMNLPTSVLPDQSIAAYWDQFLPSPGYSKIITNVFGTAPKRQFWIVWYNYSQYVNQGGASSYNAIVLEESTNKVYVVDQFSNNGSSLTATVGLQLSGATAVQYSDSLRFLNMNSLSASDVDYVEFKPRVITPYDVSADAIASPLAAKQGCYTTTEPIEVAVINYGTSSVSQVPVTVHVSGAVNQTFNTVYAGTILPNDTAVVNVGTLDMKQGGNFNFIARATYPTDGDTTNNAMVDTTRISVTVPLAMPIAPVNFDGYTGWNLAQVAPGWASYSNPGMPGGVYLSGWMESNALGTETIVLNQWADMNHEWLVGPKFTMLPGTYLYFKAAVTDWQSSNPDQMGSDDSVRVMISTDCGASYQLLRALTAADQLPNTLTPFAIDLSAYAGQDINIAFYATDGPIIDNADYDIHLDDIQVKVPVPTDAGVVALNNPLANGCYSAAENVTVTIRNFGTAPLTSVPVKVIVSGAIADTLAATYTGTLAPDSSAVLQMGTINMTTGGDYFFSAFSMLTGDGDASNDTLGTQMRTVIAPRATPLAKVDFTGFVGGNLDIISPGWYTVESSGGIIFPGPANPAVWQVSNAAQETHFGSTTARHNLFEDAVESWMIGPKVHILPNTHLTFKVAVTEWDGVQPSLMGSDDSVRVMVSTNCGISYQTIRAFTRTSGITNNLSAIDIDLSAYAGQDIIIAFYLTDGPMDDQEDYDFHFDDIQIKVPNPTDPGLNSLVSPIATGCFTNAESVEVTLVNNGTAAISNIPVQVLVSGVVTDTLNATYTGTLAPGASTVFVVGTLDMSTGGNYELLAATLLAADGDTTNNRVTASFNVLPTVALPLAPVTFTSYNGSNIDVLTNNNWKEAHGLNHPNNFAYSDWREPDAYQTQQLGFETARVGLYGSGKDEWLIGPKFVVGAATHITFDAAVTVFGVALAAEMGSDDSVHVMLSGDCGATFKSFFAITAADSLSNSLTNFDVDISALAGQEVIVAFYATSGIFFDFLDYDFHIDNILIKEKAVNDVGLVAFMGPTNGCNLSQNAAVTVKVKNFGSAAASNIPLYFTVDGSPQFTDSIAGPILPGDTATFTFTTPVDVSVAALYQFTAATTLSGDASVANDTLRALVISAPEMPVTVTGPISADFESGAVSKHDFTTNWNEQAALRIDSAAANQSQYGMLFTGRQHHDWQGGDGRGATLPVDAWVSNSKHHASAQLCVDASSLGAGYGLSLAFDLKQTYSSGPGFSWFRVLVNGTQVSPDYQPNTMNADTFQTHNLDLSAYAGTSFQVTFQSSNKFDKLNGFGNGDEAWLDNIRLDAVTVGTAENLEAKVALYPNPTSGMVQIVLGDLKNASVAVYNIQGQLVQSLKAETSSLQLDLSDLATGAYLVKIITDKEVITKKLMLQK